MDKNKKNKYLIDYLNDISNDNNKEIINKIIEYTSYLSLKSSIDTIICDKKMENDIKNIINNNNTEELLLDLLLDNVMIKYYNKFNNLLSKNDIAKLYIYVSKYIKDYINSLNMTNNMYEILLNNKIDDIEYNIKNPKCDLLNKLNNNIMKIDDIPNLDPSELDYNIWNRYVEKKKLIDYKKNNITTTDLYKCKKCKEQKCISWQMQTRSADEPMTIFVQCTICNYTFKMG